MRNAEELFFLISMNFYYKLLLFPKIKIDKVDSFDAKLHRLGIWSLNKFYMIT